jgi:hypothetical protein
MEEIPIHSCGQQLEKSIRSEDIWICVKCQVDVPKENKTKRGKK